MEVFGKPVNLKIEKFMDKMCQRIAAIQFIQKCYRGYYVRKQVMQQKEAQKQLKGKHQLMKKKAVKIIFENIDLALDRAKQIEKREEPFRLLRQHMLDSIMQTFTEKDIVKVVLI